MLHPVGVLRISQRLLPLDLTVEKLGAQKTSDVNRLHLDLTAGGLRKKGDVMELFASAQFQNMSDSDKLSRAGFYPVAGRIGPGACADLATGRMDKRVVRYEEIIIDTNYRRFQRRFRVFNSTLFHFFLNGSAITRLDMSQVRKGKFQPFATK